MAGAVTLTCRYHCSACGRHFRSLVAFDLHRVGEHDVRRYCQDPRSDARLEAAGLGECRLGFGEHDHGVVVYRQRGSVERAAESFHPAAA